MADRTLRMSIHITYMERSKNEQDGVVIVATLDLLQIAATSLLALSGRGKTANSDRNLVMRVEEEQKKRLWQINW